MVVEEGYLGKQRRSSDLDTLAMWEEDGGRVQLLHRLEARYPYKYYEHKINTILGTPFIKTHCKTIIHFRYKTWIVPKQLTVQPTAVSSRESYAKLKSVEDCVLISWQSLPCHGEWRLQQTSHAATAAGPRPAAPTAYCLLRASGEVRRWTGGVRRHTNNAIFYCSSKLYVTKNFLKHML